MKFWRRVALAAACMAVLGAATLAVLVKTGRVQTGMRWRLEAIQLKANGRGVWFQDLSWPELLRIVVPGSGFEGGYLDVLDANLPLGNPYGSQAGIELGKQVFQERCSTCHGGGARGTGAAPALAGAVLTRAHDDLSTYLVVSRGIPGTSMPAHKLPWADTWRLAAYVQSIKAHAAPVVAATQGLVVDVQSGDLVGAAEQPENWLTYSGSYSGWRYSRLKQVNAGNVRRLHVKWIHQLPGDYPRQQTVPLVVNGIMFITSPPASIAAVDAVTGHTLWSYQHKVPDDISTCCGRVNRGVALLGSQVFYTTIDAHLIALDAATGHVNWETRVADYRDDYSITSAPLAINDLIVTGVGGAEYATRGFITAFRATDGQPVWRFDAIPGPGRPGNDTWSGDSWKVGGASTWMTGSFDPRSNTLYWGTGNPAPQFNGDNRLGDNLYSDSVVALDASTGSLRWHFQFTPHDTHGWDSAQVPVLIDKPGAADGTKFLAWANRNGFFYSLDATTGAFVRGRPFATVTWAQGLDQAGRPVRDAAASGKSGQPVWPSADGATTWWPPSYDPSANLLFVPVLELAGIFVGNPREEPNKGRPFLGGAYQTVGKSFYTGVRALNATTGDLVWERRGAERAAGPAELGGMLSTAGGIVFGSEESLLQALDTRDGRVLWSFDTGAHVVAPPMTYAVKGEQFIAVAAGNMLLAFALAD